MNTTATSTGNNEKLKLMSEKERRLQKPLETKSETWKNWNGWGRDEGELIGR